eukprot:11157154-Lingulodinium_polyedra.AAC.1
MSPPGQWSQPLNSGICSTASVAIAALILSQTTTPHGARTNGAKTQPTNLTPLHADVLAAGFHGPRCRR